MVMIDTKDIAKYIGIITFGAIIFFAGCGAALLIFSPGLHPGTQVTTQATTVVVTPTATPTPEPTPTPTPTTWSSVQRVNFLSTSAGFFQATTDSGETYILQNPDDYYALSTGYYVTFQRCGSANYFNGFQWKACDVQVVRIPWDSETDDWYYEDDVSIVSSSDNYPIYYYDSSTHTAWQWDGSRSDPISVKELRGQHVRRGIPPNRR
jgi:hypothetical protein